MKRLATVAFGGLILSGCAYVQDRARDLGDILRLEGSVGLGAQVDVAAGELAHVGVGSSRRWSAGWAYGHGVAERRTEDHLPLSYAWSLLDPERESLHALAIEGEGMPRHQCVMVLPGGIGGSVQRRPALQYWNMEAGVMAGVVGLDVGFNPAEFLDFILGFFGIDIAGDDTSGHREAKRLWEPKP